VQPHPTPRNSTLISWKIWRRTACIGIAFCLSHCFRDDGLTLPGREGNATLLRRFQGHAHNEGDTTLSSKRFFKLRDPKIALVWQFLGPRLSGHAFDGGVVSVSSPYEFSVTMNNPPPPEIALSPDPVIGAFWLYSDGDGDGKLTRLSHPEMQAKGRYVDSLKRNMAVAKDSLRAASKLYDHRVPYTDTFYLDTKGNLIHPRGAKADTLNRGMKSGEDGSVQSFLFRRSIALNDMDGWEWFFILRKKGWQSVFSRKPVADGGMMFILQDWRKLFPIPGKEDEFEAKAASAGAASYAYASGFEEALYTAEVNHWVDYPYEGFESPGQDWVAGKSRWYSVLYFPTDASVRKVVDAEGAAAFRVDGLDRLRRGYNLLHCDDQYVCEVLGEEDSVVIDLGEKESYFNPPAGGIPQLPISDFKPASVPDSSLLKFEGTYALQPFEPITVVFRAGRLWADVPGRGLLGLTSVDPLRFYDAAQAIQFQFVVRVGGVSKLMCYVEGQVWVAPRLDVSVPLASMKAKVDSLLSIHAKPMATSLSTALPIRLEYGKDTLILNAHGDSLSLAAPGMFPRYFLTLNDSEAASPTSSERIRLLRNDSGAVTHAILVGTTGEQYLPNTAYRPRLPLDLFPHTLVESGRPDTQSVLISSDNGSGRDTYVKVGGGKRYSNSQDGYFLRAGDGWIMDLSKEGRSDSISLESQAGGMIFRIEGMAGKRIRLELDLCKEKGKTARNRFLIRGGKADGNWDRVLSEDAWTPAVETGSTALWESIPIPSNPYYIFVSPIRTHDAPFYYAADGYRIFSD
jgi:hypothetical protein